MQRVVSLALMVSTVATSTYFSKHALVLHEIDSATSNPQRQLSPNPLGLRPVKFWIFERGKHDVILTCTCDAGHASEIMWQLKFLCIFPLRVCL